MNHPEALKYAKSCLLEQLSPLRHPLFGALVAFGAGFVALYQFIFHRAGQVFDSGGGGFEYLTALMQSVWDGVGAVYCYIFWVLPILAGEAVCLYFAAKQTRIGHSIKPRADAIAKGIGAGIVAFVLYVCIGESLFLL